MRSFLLIIAFMCLPIIASAQVIVSEIAWMGSNNGNTATDANDEWIELYNSSSEAVDISGWSLVADDDSPKISLSGSIAPNSFFLLERSDDASVPTVSADLIYTGSLGNAGETLTLKDASGNTVQRIVSGEGWTALGGDNTTKQTPQWSGSLWVTADPTPKAPSSGTSLSQPTPPPPPSSSAQQDPSPPPQSLGVLAYSATIPRINADAGPDRTVIVGAETEFKGKAFGLKNEPLPQARFLWNFGDGGTREGIAAIHRYSIPGRYVVALEVSSGEYAGSDRAIIDAVEATLSIGFQKDARSIEIDNDGEHELDISWWIIAYHDQQFVIPKNTIALPKSTLRLSSEAVGFDLSRGGDIALLYPNGTEAARGSSSPGALVIETRSSYSQVPKVAAKVSPRGENEEMEGRVSRRESASSTLVAQVRESGSEDGDGVSMWYFVSGIVLLSVIGIIGLRISRDDTTVHGYTIIKDTRD